MKTITIIALAILSTFSATSLQANTNGAFPVKQPICSAYISIQDCQARQLQYLQSNDQREESTINKVNSFNDPAQRERMGFELQPKLAQNSNAITDERRFFPQNDFSPEQYLRQFREQSRSPAVVKSLD